MLSAIQTLPVGNVTLRPGRSSSPKAGGETRVMAPNRASQKPCDSGLACLGGCERRGACRPPGGLQEVGGRGHPGVARLLVSLSTSPDPQPEPRSQRPSKTGLALFNSPCRPVAGMPASAAHAASAPFGGDRPTDGSSASAGCACVQGQTGAEGEPLNLQNLWCCGAEHPLKGTLAEPGEPSVGPPQSKACPVASAPRHRVWRIAPRAPCSQRRGLRRTSVRRPGPSCSRYRRPCCCGR